MVVVGKAICGPQKLGKVKMNDITSEGIVEAGWE
jgi:hypothetical protein